MPVNPITDKTMEQIITAVGAFLSDYVLIAVLLPAAVYFTWVTRGVQFTMVGRMLRLLFKSGDKLKDKGEHHSVSSFQAFAVSIASRVGTGNLAGVATAIAVGGPGAVFWMWVIALLGASSAFVESTLAQLFKVRGRQSFMGGPAYYIQKGIGSRLWAVTFAVLITVTFGLAFNSVQANTISQAFSNTFDIDACLTGTVITALTLAIIWGGITSIARFSEIIVPVMAIAYIILALVVIAMNITSFPHVMSLIVNNAFGLDQAFGGGMGMAVIMGIKRGLFSNEAGEGSAPNVAATASVSHPVKQGLIQAFGVFTDTLLICTATAFIILCSGVYTMDHDGIILTQKSIDTALGVEGPGSIFVSVAIFFFAFTSIVANYYYGETNIRFIIDSQPLVNIYRLAVGAMVYIGSVSSLDFVWGFADITMALMTLCNLAAILFLGRYAVRCLNDYRSQLRRGLDPVYHSSTIPEIASQTECWDE